MVHYVVVLFAKVQVVPASYVLIIPPLVLNKAGTLLTLTFKYSHN